MFFPSGPRMMHSDGLVVKSLEILRIGFFINWEIMSFPYWTLFPPCMQSIAGLTLIPAWIVNYNHYEIWVEINYPLPDIKGETVEASEIYLILYRKRDFLSKSCLKLNHVNKTDPWSWRIYQYSHSNTHKSLPSIYTYYSELFQGRWRW